MKSMSCGRQNKEEEKLFTQKEMNEIIKKRIIRQQRNFDLRSENYEIQIEVITQLANFHIPLAFAMFIITKCPHKTAHNLRKFVEVWENFV